MNIYPVFSRALPIAIAVATMLSLSTASYGQAKVGSELDLLRRDDVRGQLGLTESQYQKIEEASKAGTISTDFFKPYLEKMKGKSPEEQSVIREEMNKAVMKAREEVGMQGLNLLDSRQLKLLRAIYVSQAGIRALTDSRVAGDLGISEEQKVSLLNLNKARAEAATELGFNSSDDEQADFKAEWEAKFLAVLNDEQKSGWASLKVASSAIPVAVPQSDGGTLPMPGQGANPASPPPGSQVVSSFGSAADAAGPKQIVDKMSFNFQWAPWSQVLQDFADSTGYTLDMPLAPTGTLSHKDSTEYNVDQALDILNGYLQRKGFALVRKDGFLVCVNVSGVTEGISPVLVPDVSVEQLTAKGDGGTYKIGENELVRVQMLLKGVDVGVMAQEVEALTGPLARMTALTQSGILIISDTGSNLRKINTFIQAAMANVEKKLIFKPYPLVNIAAEEAEYMLLAQFGMRQGAGTGVPNVSAASGRDARSQQPQPASTSALKVMSDSRTNSLFVTGSEADHVLVEEILKAIDVEEIENSRFGLNSGPFLRVYKVTGRADQAALSINAMMPGVVVNEDNAAGTVHIFGTNKQHLQVEEWVQAFAAGSGAAGSVAVIPLVKMDPLTAAAMIRSLYVSEGTSAPTIETDLYGNRLIIKGTSIQVDQIKELLKGLGEDGTGVRARGEGGTMRRYSLRGRDPAEFMPYLEEEWKNNESTQIRIVVPNRSGPIRDLRTPSQAAPRANEQRNSTPANDPSTAQSKPHPGIRKQSGYVTVRHQEEDAGEPQDARKSPAAEGQPKGPFDGVQIVVDGDDLILLYKDEDTLDRLEETMDILQQSIPYRTRWTVFYLQAADATEAAALLEKMITGSSVTNTAASTGFSFGSMFRPITDSVSSMTGLSGIGQNPQTLRIIPDTRSNSLLVTGPQALVDEAEKLLEVLDSNSIPESLRDMQPRQLTVEHADIDSVATMVRDVFKPFMEAAGGQQQQNNPFAALMGGGAGGNGKKDGGGVQMTVGVDRATSTLFISSSEALFLKVEAMVKDQDAAAKASKPTVRYVQLINSDATTVQNSLTALFPRVTSSSVRTTSSSTSDNTPKPDSSGGGSSQNSNPFSGRSGSPFGGGNPFGGGSSFGGGSPFGGGGSFGGGSSPGSGSGAPSGFSPFGGRSSRGGGR